MEKQIKFPHQFFWVTFLWSWLLWLPLVLEGAGIFTMEKNSFSIIRGVLIILGAFGPAVGAFYCLRTGNGKDAIRQYLRGLFDLRFGWSAWLIPILVFGGGICLAWVLPEIWGEPHLELKMPSLWVVPLLYLFMILLGGGQEELGWRGYILDHLEERLGLWLGNLVLGVIWAFWHLPLFFITGTSQVYFPFAAFVLFCIGNSGILAWVRQASGKRLMAGLYAHGTINVFINLFPILIMKEQVAQPRLWVGTSVILVIGLVMMMLRSHKTSISNSTLRVQKEIS